jgi:hypothetical protein
MTKHALRFRVRPALLAARFLILALSAWNLSAEAATIRSVGRTFVVVDAGSAHGLGHGDVVCIQAGDAKMIGCGNVGETRPRLAEVRLPTWTAARVKMGYRAVGRSIRDATKAPPVSQSEILTFVKVLEKIHGADAKLRPAAAAPLLISIGEGLPPATLWFRGARVRAALLATYQLPFSYRMPKYNVYGELSDDTGLWIPDREVKRAPWGSELSFSVPFTDHIALVTSGHIRKLPDDELTVSYDARDPTLGTIGKITGLTYGGGLDVEYGWPVLSALEVIVSAGVEGDMSRLRFKQKTASPLDEATIATLSSNLLVWSARLGLDFAWAMGGGFALDLGAKAILPRLERADRSVETGGLKDTLTDVQNTAAADTLKSSLNHHKAKIGSQVTLGLSHAF